MRWVIFVGFLVLSVLAFVMTTVFLYSGSFFPGGILAYILAVLCARRAGTRLARAQHGADSRSSKHDRCLQEIDRLERELRIGKHAVTEPRYHPDLPFWAQAMIEEEYFKRTPRGDVGP